MCLFTQRKTNDNNDRIERKEEEEETVFMW